MNPGPNITGQDPQLGGLTSNGGPTPTLKPAAGSPVVDQGSSSVPGDQRAFPRRVDNPVVANAPGGNAADIGSVELTLGEGPQPAAVQPPPPPAPTKKKKCKKKKKKHHSAAAAKEEEVQEEEEAFRVGGGLRVRGSRSLGVTGAERSEPRIPRARIRTRGAFRLGESGLVAQTLAALVSA